MDLTVRLIVAEQMTDIMNSMHEKFKDSMKETSMCGKEIIRNCIECSKQNIKDSVEHDKENMIQIIELITSYYKVLYSDEEYETSVIETDITETSADKYISEYKKAYMEKCDSYYEEYVKTCDKRYQEYIELSDLVDKKNLERFDAAYDECLKKLYKEV